MVHENDRGLDFGLIGLDLFIFWIFVNLDVIKFFSMFFPCDHIHPQPQGIFPLLARALP
jgi:hypothetical protein